MGRPGGRTHEAGQGGQLDPDLARFLGYYAAEGSFGSDCLNLCFHINADNFYLLNPLSFSQKI